MTIVIDDLMECLTLEIELEGKKNIVIMCVYRTPGTNVEMFKDTLDGLMNKLNENKTCLICGDTNIDLINVVKHKATSDFLGGSHLHVFFFKHNNCLFVFFCEQQIQEVKLSSFFC